VSDDTMQRLIVLVPPDPTYHGMYVGGWWACLAAVAQSLDLDINVLRAAIKVDYIIHSAER